MSNPDEAAASTDRLAGSASRSSATNSRPAAKASAKTTAAKSPPLKKPAAKKVPGKKVPGKKTASTVKQAAVETTSTAASGIARSLAAPTSGLTGPEHVSVRIPLLAALEKLGWSPDQVQWSPEWRVPATPHDASKREGGKAFTGYPVDIAIFSSVEEAGNSEEILVIFELKKPTLDEGRHQLEAYMNMESRAKMGFWTNGAQRVAVFRRPDGGFLHVNDAQLPKPTDTFAISAPEPLKFEDLVEPLPKDLHDKLERMFTKTVARDSISTRSDDRLEQLCNLLLVKLDSDKAAKAAPDAPLLFQPAKTEALTAQIVRQRLANLVAKMPDIFSPGDVELKLNDHTIHEVVYELATTKLVDVSATTISQAFQVFRAANLKSGEGQYFTPYRVIRSAIRLLEIGPDDRVIDPACGTGGFLVEAYMSLREHYPHLDEADRRTWAHHNLVGVDRDDINVKLARAIMLIVGDGSANIVVGDSIREHAWPTEYPHLGTRMTDGSFTCVITNPPFGQGLKASSRDASRNHYSISKKAGDTYQELEIGLVFLERAHRLLVVGGRLGIVLPETYFFSSTYDWLREWLDGRFELKGMMNIPMEAFQAFCRAKTNLYFFEKVGDPDHAVHVAEEGAS